MEYKIPARMEVDGSEGKPSSDHMRAGQLWCDASRESPMSYGTKANISLASAATTQLDKNKGSVHTMSFQIGLTC